MPIMAYPMPTNAYMVFANACLTPIKSEFMPADDHFSTWSPRRTLLVSVQTWDSLRADLQQSPWRPQRLGEVSLSWRAECLCFRAECWSRCADYSLLCAKFISYRADLQRYYLFLFHYRAMSVCHTGDCERFD